MILWAALPLFFSAWITSTVKQLARANHDEKAFDLPDHRRLDASLPSAHQ